MIPVETTVPGMVEGEEINENGREGWIQVWYIWRIVRTFVNVTVYPHPAQQKN
jgi:hypothetical protein